VKAVAVLGGGSLTVLVARGDSGIKSIADLKGKNISVMSFQDTTYFALLGTLASKGMSRNDVQAKAVGPGWVANFVTTGKADACACSPDMEVDARSKMPDAVSLPTLDAFPSMAQAILASDEMIAKRPELVRAIVQATLKGMKYVMDDPDAAARVYVEATPSFAGKEELIKATLKNFVKRTYSGQKVLGEVDAGRLKTLEAFYLKEGIIRTAVPIDELYTNAFVK
jgi:NitT/TauT family transport system substrate-binding protein